MNSPMPAHLMAAIRQRIAWLREAWHVDEAYLRPQPRLRDYPFASRRPEPSTSPTFPGRQSHDQRSTR
jgi:hypothetical protein